MCGIAGIIYKDGRSASAHSPILKGMLRAIAHRGPDDEGTFFEGGVALGHRRLAILDISEAGHQPMYYKDYVIVYNGEVYNYLELREELQLLGHAFETGTDTEVILHAYAQWGEDCLQRFNGMWAFALYDRAAKRLFCARDRFGVKPFYYYEDDDRFLFASEIKAILAAGVKAVVNRDILEDFLFVGLLNHREQTFFSNILKMMPSHQMNIDTATFKKHITNYYSIKIHTSDEISDVKQAADVVNKELERAVKFRLRSDVRVGTCLSGGLDSSSVVAFASRLTTAKDDFFAITAASEDPRNDESHFAKTVADHVGIRNIVVRPSFEDFIDVIEDVIMAQEEPFGSTSIFMQYFVMKTAHENGVKVLLDGQGGDEVLFGYETYFTFYLTMLIRRFKIKDALDFFADVKNFKVSKLAILRSAVVRLIPELVTRTIRRARFKKNPFQLKAYLRNTDVFENKLFKCFQIDQVSWLNIPQLVNYEDKNSMRFSIETRLPFLDYQLVEKCIALDDRIKVQNGFLKYLLRTAVNGMLPDEIVWRTNKFGFEAPQQKWLASHVDTMLESIESSNILGQYSSFINHKDQTLLWQLYNIAIWEKIYNVHA